MPVGTAGTVKAMYPDQVRALGADIILGNTYHLMLRPGAERVAALGGLHAFANWPWPILTDSGGFQVMSLAALRKHRRGRRHLPARTSTARPIALTPERSLEIQALLDSDIRMQLDECVALPAEPRRDRARDAPVAPLGRALEGRLRRRPRGGRCSASCRAATMPDLRVAVGGGARRRSASTATRSAASRSASRRRRCWRCSTATTPALPADRAALPDGRRHAGRHRRARWRAASTCSTACCRRAPAATASPTPASARST